VLAYGRIVQSAGSATLTNPGGATVTVSSGGKGLVCIASTTTMHNIVAQMTSGTANAVQAGLQSADPMTGCAGVANIQAWVEFTDGKSNPIDGGVGYFVLN
jgi:hypothetical protein